MDQEKGIKQPEIDSKKPYIGYRTQYRHRETGSVVLERYDTRIFDGKNGLDGERTEPVADEAVFDIVRAFTTSYDGSSASKIGNEASLTPSISMHISSGAIINALRSIVKYYPSQDLTGDIVVVQYPFAVLVHHFDELCDFRRVCSKKNPTDLCIRERNADQHIGVLIEFLEQNIMKSVREEQERNKKGFCTWEWQWVRFKPGDTWFLIYMNEEEPFTGVVHSVVGGTSSNPPVSWTTTVWSLDWDGTYLGRTERGVVRERYDGEIKIHDSERKITPESLTDKDDADVQKYISYGALWWSLVQKQCKYAKGKTKNFPYNEVDGNIMADLESFYTRFPGNVPTLMSPESRTWISDCTCSVCTRRQAQGETQIRAPFEEYNDITKKGPNAGPLTAHMNILCPRETWVFVFKTRSWEYIHVNQLSEPHFQEDMIDHLVMDERRKRTLKALAKSFARFNARGNAIGREQWSADFVKGKGNGLVFLLHGSPGVGKTYTAECIAAFTKRPLMILTSSDIGTEPRDVEMNLSRNFKTARSWDAVLLIDEADVFMERRSTSDLNRNSLVASFLRALEFYEGILFLTTNRVGSFDDAFVSRVHVKLFYPEFTPEQRRQVWQTFVEKLDRERGDYIRLHGTAEDYLDGDEMREMVWNGREIRNAFQTAISLSEYDDERDNKGLILVQRKHLNAVVELSRDFKEYLDELHQGDEAKRSERKFERLAGFDGRR